MFSSALKSFQSNITANYTVSSSPSSFAGAWKVFEGQNKKSLKAVSIFVFDRKSLEPQGGNFRSRSNGASRRKLHDEVVERLKKEAASLARLRHPNILELAEPVEDTRSGGLMFATEPITGTLAGLLKDQDGEHNRGRSRNEDRGTSAGIVGIAGVTIDELEIQKGLLQVAKGLEFLHESAGLVHGNLTPEAIFINQKSDWKISGLAFSGPPDAGAHTSGAPIALSELLYHDPRLPRSVQLDIDYTSPDFVMDSNISAAADIFSLGIIILALYNDPHESPLHTGGNISAYKKIFGSAAAPSVGNDFLAKDLPRELVTDVLPRLITRRPAERMSAREFQQSKFFDNVLVSTIRFLEALPGKTANEKAQFMRGLPRILEQFPKSVLDRKVLPALLEETKDRELLALVLTNVFQIISTLPSPQRALADKVLPCLREVFLGPPKGDSLREAGLVVVLENTSLLVEACSNKSFKDSRLLKSCAILTCIDVLPLLQAGLESPTHAVIDKALGCVPLIAPILDFSTLKNELFPMTAQIFSKTTSLLIKVRALEAFGVLCGFNDGESSIGALDKYTIQEKVVPLLKGIKTKEPAVMMAALGVFRRVGKIADSDFLATDVLPIIWSFSLGPLLNLPQFQEYMTLIKSLSSRIEQDQMRKLRDLASNSTPSFESNGHTTDLMTTTAGFAASPEDDFKNLVLGKKTTSSQASGSETFNWSSASSGLTLQPNFLSGSTAASTISSRAITPDNTLSAFAPLKPTSPTGTTSWSSMQNIQVLTPSTTITNSWATSHKIAGSGVNKAALTMPTTIWGVPPPPTSGSSIGFAVSPGFGSLTSLNGISQGPANLTPMRPQMQKAKSSLDQYESLI